MDEPAKFDLDSVGKRLRIELVDTEEALSTTMLNLLVKLNKVELALPHAEPR